MIQEKIKVLFILHVPPPVHGSSMVGKYIKDSQKINMVFDCRYVNLGTSASIDEIGRGGTKKLFRYLQIIKNIIFNLFFFRPELCYLALSAKGGAFYKDAVIALIIKSLGVKIVYHFHNKGVKVNQERKIDHLLYAMVFKNAAVILLSKHLYPDVRKYVKEKNVFYCANGIPEMTSNIKKKNKINSSTTEILFLSNLLESKGVFVLLEACKILKQKKIDFRCTYVGGEGDINEQQFNQQVQDFELTSHVQYVGKKFGQEKEQIFANADIFAFPTYNETFGLVNLEAMQLSLPIVSTFEGGIPDVVEDGKSGFLVPPKNVIAFAKKLEVLIKEPELRDKMGSAGRRKYQEEFTLNIFEKRLKNILITITLDPSKIKKPSNINPNLKD